MQQLDALSLGRRELLLLVDPQLVLLLQRRDLRLKTGDDAREVIRRRGARGVPGQPHLLGELVNLGVEPLRLLLLRREVVRGLLELSLGGDEPPVAAAVLTQQLGVGLLNLRDLLGQLLLLVLQHPDPRIRRRQLVHQVPRAAHRPVRVRPGVRLQQPQLSLQLIPLIVRLTSPLLLVAEPLLPRLHLRLQVDAALLRGGYGLTQRRVRVPVLRPEQHELAPVPVLGVLHRHAQRVSLGARLRVVGSVVPHRVVHGPPLFSLRLEHRRGRALPGEGVPQGLDLLGKLGGVAAVLGADPFALLVEGLAPRGDASQVVRQPPTLGVKRPVVSGRRRRHLALHDPVHVLDHLLDDDLGLDDVLGLVRRRGGRHGHRGRGDDGGLLRHLHRGGHGRVHLGFDRRDDVRLTRPGRGPAREVGPEPLHAVAHRGDDGVEVRAQALDGGSLGANGFGQLHGSLGERLGRLLLLLLLLLEDEGGEAELLEGVLDGLVRALVLSGVPLAVRAHARRRALDVHVSLLVTHDLVALHLLLGVPPLALELLPGLQGGVEVTAAQRFVHDELELVHLALHRARRLLHLVVGLRVIRVGHEFQILRARRPLGGGRHGGSVGIVPAHGCGRRGLGRSVADAIRVPGHCQTPVAKSAFAARRKTCLAPNGRWSQRSLNSFVK